MQKKRCFVAMPIRREGTDEHQHFKAIYEQGIKPTLLKCGYEVTRADEIQKSGSITKDIIVPLAEYDLVVADLTDLNPNVFYELGVRHALLGSGTIMILDRTRTHDVPFDLKIYRVIEFEGNLPGISRLTASLESYISGIEDVPSDSRDNPVHDCLPSLPVNVLSTTAGTREEELQRRLTDLVSKLDRYQRLYGKDVADDLQIEPISIISAALDDAEHGLLPSDLTSSALEAGQDRDAKAFLSVAKTLVERNVRLRPRQFLEVVSVSNSMGLDPVTDALFQHALMLYPTNRDLKHGQLGRLAHSPDKNTRARARKELMEDLGIEIDQEGSSISIPHTISRRNFTLLALLLDTYQMDETNDEEVRLAEALTRDHSDTSIVLRQYARALTNTGRAEEGLDWYRRALWCSDVDDTTATWLGNELHNRGRNVDALEAYLVASLLDPNDASGFAHAADELSFAISTASTLFDDVREHRSLPEDIGMQELEQILMVAVSCPDVSAEDVERIQQACRRVDLPLTKLAAGENRSRSARIEVATSLYARLETELTKKPRPAGTAH